MMVSEEDLILAPIEDLQDISGVAFPEEHRYRQFLITGPPGAGKSTLVSKMHGWPYEGYLDLSVRNWWRVQALTFRPREVHLGAPFKEHREALAVLDEEWLNEHETLEMDYQRILIPPEKSWFFGVDWRRKYVFDFVLPPSDKVYRDRVERAKTGLFPHDRRITPEIVRSQLGFYRSVAWYFWVSGMPVYLRLERDAPPMKIVECRNPPER